MSEAKEILLKHNSNILYSGDIHTVLEAMQEYAMRCCEEQKYICFEAKLNEENVLNAPLPDCLKEQP